MDPIFYYFIFYVGFCIFLKGWGTGEREQGRGEKGLKWVGK